MELSCSSWPMAATYRLNLIPQSHSRYRKQVSLLQGCCSTTSSLISANYPSSCSSSRLSASSFFGISLPNKLYSSTSPAKGKIKRSFYVVAGVFEKFTERAIKAVVFSQWEARALGNDMVFKEHLLLGLIAEDRSPAGFLGSGITIDMARLAVKAIRADGASDNPSTDRGEEVGKGSTNSAMDVPFSVGTKRIFEAAVEYSRINGHNYIAPEHIAIGLFSVDDGNVTRVLKRLGANINNLAAVATSRLEGELAKDGRDRPSALKRPHDKSQSGKATPSKSEGAGNKKKTALDRFCVDLTARASERRIDPVIGRDTEVQRIIQILCRRTKNNPILLGDAGVGKTAIVEGLAMNIVDGTAPLSLLTKRILSLDIGLLIAGAKERGELEERVTTLIMDIKKSAFQAIS